MKVIHISTECYPAAKAGGMGDVVGSLPKYLKAIGVGGGVLIPKYDMPWFKERTFDTIYESSFAQKDEQISFRVQKLNSKELGFDFYCIDIPGKFDRDSIYLDTDGEGFKDEVSRNIAFQRAATEWLNSESSKFDLVHCHDHMTGLIPFFMQHGNEYVNLRNTPTFFSIHNAAYHGMIHWFHNAELPAYNHTKGGLLDWDQHIHSLACAVKCADKVNTVSPSYMEEIKNMDNTLSWLFRDETEKCIGIINGIDNESWDTKTDPLLDYQRKGSWADFKKKNKDAFAAEYGLDPDTAWISFIGRFSNQKGVDTIPPAIKAILARGEKASFIILGSGSKILEEEITRLEEPGKVKTLIMYNEAVAHKIYAASDFIMMPSRFEPCGLNQMFAMRYGTVPIVRATGGLIDTVHESPTNGTGFLYKENAAEALTKAILRGIKTYENEKAFVKLRNRCTRQNFSWEKSAETYAIEYKKLK